MNITSTATNVTIKDPSLVLKWRQWDTKENITVGRTSDPTSLTSVPEVLIFYIFFPSRHFLSSSVLAGMKRSSSLISSTSFYTCTLLLLPLSFILILFFTFILIRIYTLTENNTPDSRFSFIFRFVSQSLDFYYI